MFRSERFVFNILFLKNVISSLTVWRSENADCTWEAFLENLLSTKNSEAEFDSVISGKSEVLNQCILFTAKITAFLFSCPDK